MDSHSQRILIDDTPFHLLTDMPTTSKNFCDAPEDFFTIRLTNGCDVYSSKVTTADIIQMSSAVRMDLDTFYNKFRLCCCDAEECEEVFSYEIVENNDSTKFLLKQIFEGGMGTLQLGCVELKKAENPALDVLGMLETARLQRTIKQDDEIINLQEKAAIGEAERKEMVRRLEGYVSAKETHEKELFAKFCAILNEKKARIRELKSKESGDNASNKKQTVEAKKRMASSSETDDEEETDDEVSTTKSHSGKKPRQDAIIKKEAPKKTKEKKQIDPKHGIILNSASDDDEDDFPCKNRRKMRAKTKPVVNKPLVPKTAVKSSVVTKPVEQKSVPLKYVITNPTVEDTQIDLLDELSTKPSEVKNNHPETKDTQMDLLNQLMDF